MNVNYIGKKERDMKKRVEEQIKFIDEWIEKFSEENNLQSKKSGT